jgi:putative thioredoxin
MNTSDNPYGGGYATQHSLDGESVPEQATAGAIVDTTTATFAADVIKESRNQTVLVDFWAPWCGPCKQLAPTLEKVVGEAAGRVKLVKMNIDEHPSIPGQLGIQSIPAVIAFRDGQPVDGFLGAIPESKIREFVDKVAGKSNGNKGDAAADALAAADGMREEGDLRGAAQVYAAILQQAPENLQAIAGLAEVLFEAGDVENAKDVLGRAPADKADAAEFAGIRAKLALAEEAAALGDEAELERKLSADPKDHQARFDLALVQNAKGERMAAADNLLAIMKTDRTWRDDGARQQLLKFFEAWGMNDEATLTARRRLSSLLFS